MSVDTPVATLDLPHVGWVDSLDGLVLIRDPGKTMAIHPRVPDVAIATFLNHKAVADFCCLRCEIRNVGAEVQIERELNKAGLPASYGRWAFGVDIARLVAAFSNLCGASTVNLRLDRITDDACRLFHPDNVPSAWSVPIVARPRNGSPMDPMTVPALAPETTTPLSVTGRKCSLCDRSGWAS